MHIGVLSDSHDHLPNIHRAVDHCNRAGVHRVLHAGDFVAPFSVIPLRDLKAPVVAVLGNNDGEVLGLEEKFRSFGGALHPRLAEIDVGGRRIAMVHYPEIAEGLAATGRYDLVIFGHTHEVAQRRLGDCLLLNPGEVGGWLTGRATIAVVDLASLQAEIVDLG